MQWMFIILGVLAVIVYVKNQSQDEVKPKVKKEIVYNSEYDGSVTQAKKYLRENLNDWDSYEPIEWSEVVKLPDGYSEDGAMYFVKHKFRAKNGFGASVINNKTFRFNASGKVLSMN